MIIYVFHLIILLVFTQVISSVCAFFVVDAQNDVKTPIYRIRIKNS